MSLLRTNSTQTLNSPDSQPEGRGPVMEQLLPPVAILAGFAIAFGGVAYGPEVATNLRTAWQNHEYKDFHPEATVAKTTQAAAATVIRLTNGQKATFSVPETYVSSVQRAASESNSTIASADIKTHTMSFTGAVTSKTSGNGISHEGFNVIYTLPKNSPLLHEPVGTAVSAEDFQATLKQSGTEFDSLTVTATSEGKNTPDMTTLMAISRDESGQLAVLPSAMEAEKHPGDSGFLPAAKTVTDMTTRIISEINNVVPRS